MTSVVIDAPEKHGASGRTDAEPRRRQAAVPDVTRPLLLAATALAAFAGLRMPGLWVVTQETVTAQQGFHRRALIGTLLAPFAGMAGHDYYFYAAVAVLSLAALTLVVVRTAWHSPDPRHRVLLAAFFALPAGGFMFHEVGYYEQEIYLFFFAAWWLANREHWRLASALMVAAVLTEEIALLTTVPLFALLALRRLSVERALKIVAAPVLAAVVLLRLPAASTGAWAGTLASLVHSGFRTRADYFGLFFRTQEQTWKMYSQTDAVLIVLPTLLIALAVVFVICRRRTGEPIAAEAAPDRLWIAAACVVAPAGLAIGGWDTNRWTFLVYVNLAILLWWHLQREGLDTRDARGLRAPQRVDVLALAVLVLVALAVRIPYFDGYAPRSLDWSVMGGELHRLFAGDLFRMPNV
jgi:hypothetical protein